MEECLGLTPGCAWENVKDPFTASKSKQCVLSFVKIDSQMKEKIVQY